MVAVNQDFCSPSFLMQSKERRSIVLRLRRHVKEKKKKGRSHLSKRVTHSLPINTLYKPCLHIPLSLWLVQQPASQAEGNPKARLCMVHFFRHSRGFCFAFNLQRLPAYLIREVTLTCHVLTLRCKSYFSHCQHLHRLAWKEGLW